MIDETDNGELTCRDIESEEFLEAYAVSEELHDFREVHRDLVTDLSFCKIVYIEEECSHCSARMPGVVVIGDAPELMDEYKQMISEVYDAFYENPRSAKHITLSRELADARTEAQIEIQKTLLEVIELASDNRENMTDKQSEQELWAQTLGPEYANAD